MSVAPVLALAAAALLAAGCGGSDDPPENEARDVAEAYAPSANARAARR